MKEWESQNLIFLLRLKLRAQAIKGLISVWCVQGPGNSHPRFLPWAESRKVKSSAQQAGVGLTACPARRMELLTACPPRRMGLLAACPLRRMGLTACPPVEDGAGHGMSPCGGWGWPQMGTEKGSLRPVQQPRTGSPWKAAYLPLPSL